jgi:hypothetical protein
MARKRGRTHKEKHEETLKSLVLLLAVAVLPMQTEDYQKVFFNPFIKDFGIALAKQGLKEDNGVTFVHKKFVNDFCNSMYKHLTMEERKQYYLVIGYVSLFVSFLFEVLMLLHNSISTRI